MYIGYFILTLGVFWIIAAMFFKLPRKVIITSFIIIWLSIFGFVIYIVGIVSLLYILSFLLVIFCFCLSFYADRIYNYLFVIIFLTLTPFLLILKFDEVAEVLAAIAFLFLVLGFIKDAFYEKFIKN